jgi:PAS domain-containing protein
MDSLADAVIVYDLAGAVIARNQAATRLLGESLGSTHCPRDSRMP